MGSDEMISISGVSKKYSIGRLNPSGFVNNLKGLFRKADHAEEFWALRDIDLSIQSGEALGVIGRNGAGKSTLLKIISRITYPTTGRVEINGKVSSLLEVGTGFHQELTGRENIYLNATILGMTRQEVRGKLDEIIDFAEVDRFIDTPIKHYSSGMQVRLAFSVAAHLEPEIMVIDEVLAVGDAAFQKKCLGRMDNAAAEGRTIIFVSHNMEAVKNLCSKGVLLNKGRIESTGNISDVTKRYLEKFYTPKMVVDKSEVKHEQGGIEFLRAEITADKMDGLAILSTSEINLEFEFLNKREEVENLDVTFHLVNEENVLVFMTSSVFSLNKSFQAGKLVAKCKIPSDLLNEGSYTLARVLVIRDKGTRLMEVNDLLSFEVTVPTDGRTGWMAFKEGVVRPNINWELHGS